MKIHFIGIGGIGVSALAQYYLAKGGKVSGSDLTSSEIIDLLKKKGAKIYLGSHKPKNLPKDTDLVIYSPAVAFNNSEFKKAKTLKIKIKSYPQALGELTKNYFTIAVAGTHGKSTVTAMLGLVLVKAGLDPTIILGTKLKEFKNSNFRLGKSKYLVIEADEWQASFLNYWPNIIVVTNIEREHLDYYKDLDHILRTYKEFINRLLTNGVLIINGEDNNIKKLKIQILGLRLRTQTFSLKQKEVKKLRKILKIPGDYNLLNALSALTLARVLKISDRISFKTLSEYKGAWRRFETFNRSIKTNKLKTINYKLISDYAHHPTEIAATLKTARQKYPKKKIWCVFQPHQHQRTFYLFGDFIKVFRGALVKKQVDKLIITDIYDVAGREVKDLKKKVNSKKLIKTINKTGAVYLPKARIINHLKKNLKGGEVIIIMGAGNIYKIVEELK